MRRKIHFLTVFAMLAFAVPLAAATPATTATGRTVPMVDADGRANATAAFAALKKRTPDADVVWKAGQPGAHVVVGLDEKAAGKDLIAKARSFVSAQSKLVGIDATAIRYIATSRSKRRIVVRFQQVHRGIEVVDRLVAVRMDPDGTIIGLVSDAMPITKLATARLTADDARNRAATYASNRLGVRNIDATKLTATQVILAAPGRAIPAFVVEVTAVPMRAHLQLIISATTGHILKAHNHVQH